MPFTVSPGVLTREIDLTTIVPTYYKKRASEYPSMIDFIEAYTEKEILSNSTKSDAYVTKYKKVRSDNPKD